MAGQDLAAATTAEAAKSNTSLRMGTVTAVSSTGATVSINGATVGPLPVLGSYSARTGDVVAILRQDSSWLVLGVSSGAVESWHAVTLLNGFVNDGAGFAHMSYRLCPSPPNTIQVVGTIVSGATTAGGTRLFTLPVGYRPIAQQTHVGMVFNTGAMLVTTLDTNGDVKLWGAWANGNIIMINSNFPLDLA